MIDPSSVTNYAKTKRETEEFWLFALLAAGKNAEWASRAVHKLLKDCPENQSIFSHLVKDGGTSLFNTLVANSVGQYHRLTRAIQESAEIDLETATVEVLESIYGVGPKTARFFLLHTRPSIKCAVLDTHILRWLREECDQEDAPKRPPSKGDSYRRWEVLAMVFMEAKYPHLTIAQADLFIWAMMSGRLEDDFYIKPPQLPGVAILDGKGK